MKPISQVGNTEVAGNGLWQVVFSLLSLLWDLGEVLVLATLGLGPWGVSDDMGLGFVTSMSSVCHCSAVPHRNVPVTGELEKLGQWQGDGQGDPGGEGNWVGCPGLCPLAAPSSLVTWSKLFPISKPRLENQEHIIIREASFESLGIRFVNRARESVLPVPCSEDGLSSWWQSLSQSLSLDILCVLGLWVTTG